MSWFLRFCSSFLSTVNRLIWGAWQRFVTFIGALISPLRSKKQATSTPTKTTTETAKSKRTASQSSSQKKQSSGTKRGRPKGSKNKASKKK